MKKFQKVKDRGRGVICRFQVILPSSHSAVLMLYCFAAFGTADCRFRTVLGVVFMQGFSGSDISEEIYECLSNAYRWLAHQGRSKGHWEEVRSTSLAGICLSLRKPEGAPWLRTIRG